MNDLTVIILTRNEEKNIEKCIKSFKNVAKRFVIVDSFSNDKTNEICIKLAESLSKEKIILDFYQHKWIDYATQLNWAINNTNINTKWTMRMDADEEVLPELVKEINDKLPNIDDSINGIILKRRLIFMGKWIKHGGRYPEFLLRIWRTGYGLCEQKKMDEHIILNEGKTMKFKNDIVDNNNKDLEWWINKHNWYSNREVLDYQETLSNEDEKNNLLEKNISSVQAKTKRVIKKHGYYQLPLFFRAHIYFIYRFWFRLGFLDGKEGKIFNFLQAYWYRFLVDAKIYECNKFNKKIPQQGELKG